MILVTFDSNVWRLAVSLSRFPKEPEFKNFDLINRAIRNGVVGGRLAETVFSLEALQRADRRNFFPKYRPNLDLNVTERSAGEISVSSNIRANLGAHPGNNRFLTAHLADALKIGFKLMRCPRIAGVTNPDLKNEWFASCASLSQRVNMFMDVGQQIEVRGAGIAMVKEIGRRYAAHGESWLMGLMRAPASEKLAIAVAVAEWADADSVAAHISYRNDFFCTRDTAIKAGPTSVFSESNRKWLEKDYGLRLVLPQELAGIVVSEM